MADKAEDDDDEAFFGDFKFASYPTNPAVHSQPSTARNSSISDDDWGDFINHSTQINGEFQIAGTFSHIISLPNPSDPTKPFDSFGFFTNQSQNSQPNELAPSLAVSDPNRIEPGNNQWKKLQGALPLSIFGEEEKEEESGSGVPSFDVATELFSPESNNSVNKGLNMNMGVGINDLLANLYSHSPRFESKSASNSDFSEAKLNRPNSVSNGLNANTNGGLNWDLNVENFDRDALDSDSKALTSNLAGGNEDIDEDDGWEFKGAESETRVGDDNSKSEHPKADNGLNSNFGESNSSWNGLGSSLNGWNSNFDVANGDKNRSNSDLANGKEDNDHDDEWEFNGVESNTQVRDGNFKSDQVKAENGSKLDLIGSNWGWNGLSLDWNALNSSFVGPNSTKGLNSNSVVRSENTDSDDGWEFVGADSKTQALVASELSGLKVEGPTVDGEIQIDGKGQTKSEEAEYRFEFGNGAHSPNDLFVPSDGISDQSGEWNFGFEFKPNSGTQDAFISDSWSKSKKNDTANGLNSSSVVDNAGSGIHGSSGLVVASDRNFNKSAEWDIRFCFDPSSGTQENIISDSYAKSKQNDTENGLNSSPVEACIGSNENFGEFKDSFSETGSEHKEGSKVPDMSSGAESFAFDEEFQRIEVTLDNYEAALPLPLHSVGKLESDDPMIHNDIFKYRPPSYPKDGIKSSCPNISINDLISSLYNQDNPNPSVDCAYKPSEIKVASTQEVLESDLLNGDDDFEDDSWEFKDAFSETRTGNQIPAPDPKNSYQNFSTKVKPSDYTDFYCKLKDELCFVTECHLENLKRSRSVATLSGEYAKVKALDEEIEGFCSELHRENMISKEVNSENHSPRHICLNECLEVLQAPKFQVLESEYHLSRRLSLAENDLRSAVELLKHVELTLKIVMSGSVEEQFNYVSTWSKMISVCAQELKHGASIWEKTLQKNMCSQVLSEPQGKRYILALGEIYRVVEILGASAKLYKPWILLSSADATDTFVLLSQCSALWSSSGLKEALQSISDPIDFQYNGTVNSLLDSIKSIQDLDVLALQNHVFSHKEPTCQLSVLTQGTVPDMKMVIWNGENYYLTLANLWANLIGSDPPKLPHILHTG